MTMTRKEAVHRAGRGFTNSIRRVVDGVVAKGLPREIATTTILGAALQVALDDKAPAEASRWLRQVADAVDDGDDLTDAANRVGTAGSA